MDWPQLKVAVRDCTACKLHSGRAQSVFGVGDEAADWLFIGEGPGAEEDARGEPFVGQAGRLLDNMLAAIDLKRGSDVYITNIVKCRPPNNRAPEPNEAAACIGYLRRQIALIQPRLLIALGKTAANNLLGNEASIASLRGRLHDWHGVPLIVTYHPAYLLRTLPDKARAWEDLCFARETMARLKAQAAGPN
jgi:DNA polymerase